MRLRFLYKRKGWGLAGNVWGPTHSISFCFQLYQGLSERLAATQMQWDVSSCSTHTSTKVASNDMQGKINGQKSNGICTQKNRRLTWLKTHKRSLHMKTHLSIPNTLTHTNAHQEVNRPPHHWLWPVNNGSLNSISPLCLIQPDQPHCQ